MSSSNSGRGADHIYVAMNRTAPLVVVAGLALASCAPPPRGPAMESTAPAPDGRTTSAARSASGDAIRRLYEERINAGDLVRVGDFIDESYVGPNGERGPAGFARTVESLKAAFPDIRFVVEDIVDAGDRVAIRWSWDGTHTGSFRGIAPTGKRVHNTGIALYRMRGAKAVASVLESDRLGVLVALGVVDPAALPTPPGPSGDAGAARR
jgi:predicted ester cyclase